MPVSPLPLFSWFFTYCTLAPFCIICTRLKSCFGGFNEQSGYLVSKKVGSLLGPYLEAWGSLLILETVVYGLGLP